MEWLTVSKENVTAARQRLKAKFIFTDGFCFSSHISSSSAASNVPNLHDQVAVLERSTYAFIFPCSSDSDIRAASSQGVLAVLVPQQNTATLYLVYTVCLDLGLGAYYAESHTYSSSVRILAISSESVDISVGPEFTQIPCHGNFPHSPFNEILPPKAVVYVILFHLTTSFARLKNTLALQLLSPSWAEALGRRLGISGCGWLSTDAGNMFAEFSESVIFPPRVHYPADRLFRELANIRIPDKDKISDLQLALKTLLLRIPCPIFPTPNNLGDASTSSLEMEIWTLSRKYPEQLFREIFPFILRQVLISDPSSYLALRLLPLGSDEGWTRRETQNFVIEWLRHKWSEISAEQVDEVRETKLVELVAEISRFIDRPNINLLRALRSEIACIFGEELFDSTRPSQSVFDWEEDPMYVLMRAKLLNSVPSL
jgi:hypothetical protein